MKKHKRHEEERQEERQEKAEPMKQSGRITLMNLFAEGKEIWVRNLTGKGVGKESGNLSLQVGQGNVVHPIVIPPGNDPVCLTDQVNPKLLAECMDLYKMVDHGALELLDPRDAEAYYAKNKERKVAMQEKLRKLMIQEKDKDGSAPRPAIVETNVAINQKVGDVCLKSKHAAITEREALERLLEQENVLTMDDYNYILSNGVFSSVKNWAQDQIKKVLVKTGMDPIEARLAQRRRVQK